MTVQQANPEIQIPHIPVRVQELDNLETQVRKASALARALWLMVDSQTLENVDPRDRAALRELAGSIADHSSAAVLAFERENAREGT